jgi:glycosyltransferase involved in cell wall biosynthesis
MKVVFATYDMPNDVGGVSSWLQRLLPYVVAAGIDVEVHVSAFGDHPGINCAYFAKHGIPFRWKPWILDTRRAVRHCFKMIEESQPDIYVPNCILPAYFAAGYARLQGIKTVGILHSDDSFARGLFEEFVDTSPQFRLSGLVTVSRYLEDLTRDAVDRHQVVARRISYGVPMPSQVAAPPDGIFRMIYTGRLEEEQKRISDVTRSLCAVVKKNPRIEAWIVGDGTARNDVEQIIHTSGCDTRRIRLLGRVNASEIASVLTQCHVLVLLSDYEGLPNSVLEAMAAGVVPVCLDIRSGIREAIRPGFNGLIVKNREEDFYSAVETLEQDTDLWARLAANARKTAEEHYSEQACAASWIDFLGSLYDGQHVGRFESPRFVHLPRRNTKIPYDYRFNILSRARVELGRIRRQLFSTQ